MAESCSSQRDNTIKCIYTPYSRFKSHLRGHTKSHFLANFAEEKALFERKLTKNNSKCVCRHRETCYARFLHVIQRHCLFSLKEIAAK